MLISSSDMVVHLAGPPSVAESFRRSPEYVRIHVGGTAALLQACHATGVQKLVYISSAQVYGNPTRNRVPEDHLLSPRSPYGSAKVAAEQRRARAIVGWEPIVTLERGLRVTAGVGAGLSDAA